MPIAIGRVPVGHPVDAQGAATTSWAAMIGLAGRAGPDRVIFEDGEAFDLITDKSCLMILTAPMDLTIAGMAYRLAARENHYVEVRKGKIIDFNGRDRR
jgi:hypothetical protein